MKKRHNVIVFNHDLSNFECIKSQLEELYPNQLDIHFADDILVALETLSHDQFQIVFADIDLYTKNGFNLISILKSFAGEIIFQSSCTDFAINAYDLCAADYLLKPFLQDRLKKAFDKAFANLKAKEEKAAHLKKQRTKKVKKLNSLIVKDQDSNIVLKTTDIVYLYADKGITYLKTLNKTYQQYNTLTNLEKLLDQTSFLRTSRSYICNLNYVKSIVTLKHNRYALVLNDGSRDLSIPIRRGIKLKIIDRIKKSQTYTQAVAS